jgi:EAL domain-containing protein (putative c-di-GMP-specific phosphodiesterase class I)
MIEYLHGAAHGNRNVPRWSSGLAAPPGARLLLVGGDSHWSRAIRSVAQDIPFRVVDAVPSGHAALARLLDPHLLYSHVLLNPARDDGLLTAILGLTCDEESSGSTLLLLGRAPGAPSHISVIRGPSHEAIRTALAMACCADARAMHPSLAVLRAALTDGRIDIRYQPLVRLIDGKPAGVEALARLYRVGFGLIGPDHFVPRIEDAGLAAVLTRLVARRSLADLTSPELSGLGRTVSLNAPLELLLLPDALRWMDDEVKTAGVAASRVVIELTESQVVADLHHLRQVVERLRHAGYNVALDDVSPAMPHYAALLDMPFTAVKIDKDVVRRGAVTRDAADFVERIIAVAKARDLMVVVEGVEDVRTWNRMRRAGADLAQGHVIARPLPASVLPVWLDAWRARTDLN